MIQRSSSVSAQRFGFSYIADVASRPVLLLVANVFSLVIAQWAAARRGCGTAQMN
jgi:hypothetical protein